MVAYIATIHKKDDSDYGIQFYDFSGCITAGSTIEKARQMANEVLNGHIFFILQAEVGSIEEEIRNSLHSPMVRLNRQSPPVRAIFY